MKKLKIALFIILGIVGLCCLGGYTYYQSLKPDYAVQFVAQNVGTPLKQSIDVYYDNFGIPHIYASNEEDAHYALGYVHAKDRLWQMELLRRVAGGRLADILGPDLLDTDKFFRTIGFNEIAKRSYQEFQASPNTAMRIAAEAYIRGINQYISEENTPVEFTILGVPLTPFTVEDAFLINCYTAFGFNAAFMTDPLVTRIYQQYGESYLNDLNIHWEESEQKIPVFPAGGAVDAPDFISMMDALPTPPWTGSNGWVLGPKKTKHGKVLFQNDTHIGYASPSVWYEAHLEYPGQSLYGNYLAGVPFAVCGNNARIAWGLTMFENDDTDFYVEQPNPDNPDQVKFKDAWEDLKIHQEVIKIKGAEDYTLTVKTSRHGPIINEVIEDIPRTTTNPVSMWWSLKKLGFSLEPIYLLNHSQNMDEVSHAISLGTAPGLNVMYGDVDGNIAWWTMAKLPIRPDHLNSKLFHDGSSGEDEIGAYMPFEQNPHAINPPAGYVYSANNQPVGIDGTNYPGYYIPEDRAKRIVQLLETDKKWDVNDIKQMTLDTRSLIHKDLVGIMLTAMEKEGFMPQTELEQEAVAILQSWDGEYGLDALAPAIFFKLIYETLALTFLDELGEEDFDIFLRTHLYKRSYKKLFQNPDAKWWDDISTEDHIEERNAIFVQAFSKAVVALGAQLGGDIQTWTWDKVHTIEHPHLFSQNEQLKPYFNVGPFPVPGATEVINNYMFKITEDGQYKVTGGPAKRRIIDFGALDKGWSILPTGQSGNPLSPHYDDQAEMYVRGEFRPQMMNKEEIIREAKHHTVIKPQ